MAELFRDKEVDLICLAGYMRILGKSFIQGFQGKIVNIHPSLLPAFPGLDAQRKALEAGVKSSGCTVHFVTEQVDRAFDGVADQFEKQIMPAITDQAVAA